MTSNGILFSRAIFFAAFAGAVAAEPEPPTAEPAVCIAESNAIGEVEARYKPMFDAAEGRSKELEKEADDTKLIEVNLEWRYERIVFDLPTINMKTKKMSLHLPQVSMKTRKMSFHIVETYMATTKCGQYPEFRCDGWKCKTKWSDIKCDLPQTRRKKVEFSMDIPETKWDRTEFSMDIPEISMARQEWKFRIPENIKVETLISKQKDMEEKGKALKGETEVLVQSMQKDVAEKANSLFQCHRGDLQGKRSAAMAEFDKALKQINASIQTVVAQGGDPRSITNEQGTTTNLYAIRDDLNAKREEAEKNFSTALASLDESEKKGLGSSE